MPNEWIEESLPQATPEANFSAGIRCSLVKWAVYLRGLLQGPLHIPPRLGAVWSLWGLSLGPAQPRPMPCPSLWEEGSRPPSAHPNASKKASGNLLITQQGNIYATCPRGL